MGGRDHDCTIARLHESGECDWGCVWLAITLRCFSHPSLSRDVSIWTPSPQSAKSPRFESVHGSTPGPQSCCELDGVISTPTCKLDGYNARRCRIVSRRCYTYVHSEDVTQPKSTTKHHGIANWTSNRNRLLHRLPKKASSMSTQIQQGVAENNEQYAASFTSGHLALPPARKYLVGMHSPSFER